ncbi:hypothetical protein VKT23_016132 [Stygiomarasmius scandens]|uniref:Uncharacterized protein n=1 Tax=Marasmiellus scandens TaxID=2682957 RepID=A0ABR1IYZ7_9AGAR
MLHKSPKTTLFTIPFGTAGHVMIISVYVTLLSRKTIRKKYDKQFHGISDFQITAAAAEHSVAGTESSSEDPRRHGAALKAAMMIEAESPNRSPYMPKFDNNVKGAYAE